MIFKIEKVDPFEAMVCYEVNSFLVKICEFWEFLNLWAVVKNERAEAMYNLCYDGNSAVEDEDLLTTNCGNLIEIVQRIIDMLETVQSQCDKKFRLLQKNLCD
jgi:hypothetical protein